MRRTFRRASAHPRVDGASPRFSLPRSSGGSAVLLLPDGQPDEEVELSMVVVELSSEGRRELGSGATA